MISPLPHSHCLSCYVSVQEVTATGCVFDSSVTALCLDLPTQWLAGLLIPLTRGKSLCSMGSVSQRAQQSTPCWGGCGEEANSPGQEIGLPFPHPKQSCALALLTHTQALDFAFLAGSWNSIQKWTSQRLNSTEPSPSPPPRMWQDTYCWTSLPLGKSASPVSTSLSLLWRQLHRLILICPV